MVLAYIIGYMDESANVESLGVAVLFPLSRWGCLTSLLAALLDYCGPLSYHKHRKGPMWRRILALFVFAVALHTYSVRFLEIS